MADVLGGPLGHYLGGILDLLHYRLVRLDHSHLTLKRDRKLTTRILQVPIL